MSDDNVVIVDAANPDGTTGGLPPRCAGWYAEFFGGCPEDLSTPQTFWIKRADGATVYDRWAFFPLGLQEESWILIHYPDGPPRSCGESLNRVRVGFIRIADQHGKTSAYLNLWMPNYAKWAKWRWRQGFGKDCTYSLKLIDLGAEIIPDRPPPEQ